VLGWRRLRDHLRPYNAYDVILLRLAFGGLLLAWHPPLALSLARLVAINALAVMATHSDRWRYLFSVRGSLYVLATIGLVSMRWVVQIARRQARA